GDAAVGPRRRPRLGALLATARDLLRRRRGLRRQRLRRPAPQEVDVGAGDRCGLRAALVVARGARRGAAAVIDDRPRYMISVAAELVGMHPQTLRMYEQKGLVRPQRTAGNTRLYSEADVERLRIIQRLTTEWGLNLAGVERVLQMEDELHRMRRRLERMEQELRHALDQVH